jgi:hypothetical protein
MDDHQDLDGAFVAEHAANLLEELNVDPLCDHQFGGQQENSELDVVEAGVVEVPARAQCSDLLGTDSCLLSDTGVLADFVL